ncbi:hypothetical protein [Leptospira idonii]|uniref:Uncharacterized protein n=1 Tax=Leptospira idonii TaxID=1193500 RepID=A0A4R9LZE9_9LEPT|nr:hypothetical protein [Leptospira idonii]TGN17484.1 hypothetical protein EHS15_17075 [Leptospira idonii]
MSFIEGLLNAEKKIPIGILGIVFSLIFGIFGAYTFFYDKKSNLSFKIKADFNVLDIKEPIDGLSILLNNRDLKKEKLNLRIVKIFIINDGENDLLENFYDSKKDFGLQVELPSKIIQIRNVTANSSYLKDTLNNIKLQRNGFVSLPKAIFERNDFISLDLVILHDSSAKKPEVKIIGKIAGIKKLQTTDDTKPSDETNLLYRTFAGSAGIQIIRTISYFIIGIIIIALIIYIITTINEKIEKRKINLRKQKINSINIEFTSDTQLKWIFSYYIKHGSDEIRKLEKLLLRPRILKEFIKQLQKEQNLTKTINHSDRDNDIARYLLHNKNELAYQAILEDLITFTTKGERINIQPKLIESIKLILSLE